MAEKQIPITNEDEPVAKALPFDIDENATNLLHDLLGFTADTARANPDLAKEKLEERWAGVKQFVERVTLDDEAELDAARAQVRDLRAKLEKHGVDTSDQMERLPDQIHTRYQADQAEQNERIVAGLQQLADVIAQAGQTISQTLQEEAIRLKKQSDDV